MSSNRTEEERRARVAAIMAMALELAGSLAFVLYMDQRVQIQVKAWWRALKARLEGPRDPEPSHAELTDLQEEARRILWGELEGPAARETLEAAGLYDPRRRAPLAPGSTRPRFRHSGPPGGVGGQQAGGAGRGGGF